MNVSEANATNTVLRALMNTRGRRTAVEQARLAQDAEFLAHKASGALGAGTYEKPDDRGWLRAL